MKLFPLILLIAYAILLGDIRVADATQYLYKKGDYLGHGTSPEGTLSLSNYDKNTSVFATSDQGQGVQFELVPYYTNSDILVGPASESVIECQKPVGNPKRCVSHCPNDTTCKAPVIDASYTITTPDAEGVTKVDYLNEKGTADPSQYNYVYLDTLVNNSNALFDMAITTAPLYHAVTDPTTQMVTSAAGTIAAALESGSFNFINNIYNQASKPEAQRAITIGSTSYPLTFLSFGSNSLVDGPVNPDGRFTLYGKNQHNPAADRLSTKKHMALYPQSTYLYPSLALGVTPDSTMYQTIILYPRNPFTSCQPVIFIGRDASGTNVFYAATYLLNFTAEDGNQCCQTTAGSVCAHDTLYCPTPQQSSIGCALVSANQDGAIAQGQPARLKVTIDPMPGLPEYGWASKIEILPGLWWPGQPDFGQGSIQVPGPQAQNQVVALALTSAKTPPAPKKKG